MTDFRQVEKIQVLLYDGTFEGVTECKVPSSRLYAYKIPRYELNKVENIKILENGSVYLLIGRDDSTGNLSIYVGRADKRKSGEGVIRRLKEHDAQKEFWKEAIVMTMTDGSFGFTETSYLENYFYNIVKENKKISLFNTKEPSRPAELDWGQEIELQKHIFSMKNCLQILGYGSIFKNIRKLKSNLVNSRKNKVDKNKKADVIWHCIRKSKIGNDCHGQMRVEGDKYILLKGSKLNNNYSKIPSNPLKEQRKMAYVVDNILQEDIIFNSPSQAAVFVIGNSVNGWDEWKLEDGRKLNILRIKK